MAKAVVATSSGGVPEIVLDRETGFLVPPAKAEPLAEAVLSLLNNPQWAVALGVAGRHRAEAQFSITCHVEAVESLYRGAMEVRR